ncbi:MULTISPECIES: hypothetical protein [unclassified Kribbella]|uniref:hypothetical protein n=1 Tax=unclassified Kribbella TaxID=2644121 RepID=UPI0037AC026C|nr:hypothetical protein OG817_30340 [Kribbella sp. NBC_00889]
MAQANIADLENLYDKLVASMNSADQIVTDVDGAHSRAAEEWHSKGATEFATAWVDFKSSLTNMCQAFAAAANDVAFQQQHFKIGAKEEGQHRDLPKVTSPR